MKLKKHIVCIIVLLSISIGVSAQSRPHNMPYYDLKYFHFGYVLGYNYADFAIQPRSDLNNFDSLMRIETSGMSGFDVGIVVNFRLGNYFDFRFIPNISLLDKRVDYQIQYGNIAQVSQMSQSIESVNLNFPILIKLKSSRMGNFRFYAIGGAQYSFDMASRSKKRNPTNAIVLKLNAHDVTVQSGVGLDFYLESFKLSLEAKMSYGVVNIHRKEDNKLSECINKLSSKTFHFSILFE